MPKINLAKEKLMGKWTKSFTRVKNIILMLVISFCVSACDIELYQGLSEKEANSMLSTLLKNGISASKVSAGKDGFTVLVDESRLVQALEILNHNSLPSEKYQNLGSIFAGDSMIASAGEENARLAYAISQELSDTISRVDGVLTSRVHIVLGSRDQAGDLITQASASIFVRHNPESPVVNYTPQLRDMIEKSVPDLNLNNISITLMPVREEISTPMALPPSFFTAFLETMQNSWLILSLLALTSFGTIFYIGRVVFVGMRNKKLAKAGALDSANDE